VIDAIRREGWEPSQHQQPAVRCERGKDHEVPEWALQWVVAGQKLVCIVLRVQMTDLRVYASWGGETAAAAAAAASAAMLYQWCRQTLTLS